LTFTGGRGGGSVIDYVIGDEETRERVLELRVGENVDSDHQSVEVWVKGENARRKRGEGAKMDKCWKGVWSKEGIKRYRKCIEGGTDFKEGERIVEGQEMERIKMAIKEVEEGLGNRKERKRGWWDGECLEGKRKLKRELKEWRRQGGMAKVIRKKGESIEFYARKRKGRKKRNGKKW
jgi:hypothetical protein